MYRVNVKNEPMTNRCDIILIASFVDDEAPVNDFEIYKSAYSQYIYDYQKYGVVYYIWSANKRFGPNFPMFIPKELVESFIADPEKAKAFVFNTYMDRHR